MDLSETSQEAQRMHAATLLKLEAQRRAKSLFVPTDPVDVKVRHAV